jgi:hypothetical protein
MTWGWLEPPEPWVNEPAWIEQFFDPAGYRERHAAYWAQIGPIRSNPEMDWYDQVGPIAYTMSEYGLPGAPEVPDAVQQFRRERRWA